MVEDTHIRDGKPQVYFESLASPTWRRSKEKEKWKPWSSAAALIVGSQKRLSSEQALTGRALGSGVLGPGSNCVSATCGLCQLEKAM